jgi:hypothetical protein
MQRTSRSSGSPSVFEKSSPRRHPHPPIWSWRTAAKRASSGKPSFRVLQSSDQAKLDPIAGLDDVAFAPLIANTFNCWA